MLQCILAVIIHANNGNSAKLQVNCNQILSNLELGLDLDLDE